MNTKINELKQVLMDNNIDSINGGMKFLEGFFDGFEYHECKDEYMNMTKKEKKDLVTLLLEPEEKTTDEVSESDIDDGLIEPEETTEETEIQQLIQQEIKELQEQIKQLEEQLKPLKERLFDLTGHSDKQETKMDKAIRIFDTNQGVKRKDMLILFQQQAGLTKSGSATYFNNIRNSKKKS